MCHAHVSFSRGGARSVLVSWRSFCIRSLFVWICIFCHSFSRRSSSNGTQKSAREMCLRCRFAGGSGGQDFKDKKAVEECEKSCVEISRTPWGLERGKLHQGVWSWAPAGAPGSSESAEVCRCTCLCICKKCASSSRVISPQPDCS